MERTTNRQKKRTGAFTLAEFLVVIAIITILAGVSFVAAIRYQRRLRRMEMDHTAKEIFLAAQNQLSLETANGSIERLLKESTDDPDDKLGSALADGLYYILYQADAENNENESIRERLLPFGSIDETVRSDGNYIIIYEPSAGMVRTVWYSEQYVFAATDLSDEKLAEAAADPGKREQYGDVRQPIGYYAGDTVTNPEIKDTVSLKSPNIHLENGDVLSAKVTYDASEGASLKLWVKGVASGATVSMSLTGTDANSTRVREEKKGEISVTLDDIFTSDCHIRDLNKDLIPGEDLEVYVEATKKNVSVQSKHERCNSLFQEVKNGEIQIASFRQLENLDNRISGFEPEKKAEKIGLVPVSENPATYAVVQKKDLCWDPASGNVVYYLYKSGSTETQWHSEEGCFVAINPSVALIYDGEGHSIDDLLVQPLKKPPKKNGKDAGYQDLAMGLFGQVEKDLTVKNLKLVRPDVTSVTCSGGLIGTAKTSNVVIEDVLVQYPMIVSNGDKPGTSDAAVDAGALIGSFEGEQLTLQKTMASNTNLTTTLKQKEESTQADAISNSISEKLRIKALKGAAGGLIGSATGKVTLSSCVSSVYVYAYDLAGGLIANVNTTGDQDQVLIENCYVSGHTKNGVFQTDSDPTVNMFQEKDPFDAKKIPYNIVSKATAGGLAAILPTNTVIRHTYVTASIWSNGLTNNEQLEQRQKETAFVARKDDKNATSGIAATENQNDAEKRPYCSYCYSASVVKGADSNVVLNAEKIWDYSETLDDYFKVSYPERGKAVFPYDATLKKEENSEKERTYPMPTVIELVQLDPDAKDQITAEAGAENASRSKYFSKFVRVHVGDWLDPSLNDNLTDSLTFQNGNRLWVDYEMKKPQKPQNATELDTQYLTFSIQGETSGQTVYYILKSTDQFGEDATYYYEDISSSKIAQVRASAETEPWKLVKDMTPKRLEIRAVGIGNSRVRIRLYLDDRSIPNGSCEFLHLNRENHDELSGTQTGALLPGENLIVRASRNHAIPKQDDESDLAVGAGEKAQDKINSCFAQILDNGDGTFTAEIANGRHLVNLGFCDQTTLKITKAKQTENIFWETEDSDVARKNSRNIPYCQEMKEHVEHVYIYQGDTAFTENENSFKPIENENLREYDGNKKHIANLKIAPQKPDENDLDIPSALFINNWNLSVHDLTLKDPQIEGSKDAAAILAFSQDEPLGSDSVTTSVSSSLTFKNLKIYGDKLRIRGTQKEGSCVGGILSSAVVDRLDMNNIYVYDKAALLDRREENDQEENYGNTTTGGLIGSLTINASNEKKPLKIKQCMFSGYLDGSFSEDTGGLIGRLKTVETGPNKEYLISECYVAGRNDDYLQEKDDRTEGNFNKGICMTGRHHIGGLLGYVNGQVKIEKSFSMAGFYGYAKDSTYKTDDDQISSIGGLVGYCENLTNLYLTTDYYGGIITTAEDNDGANIGILVGHMSYSDKKLGTGETQTLMDGTIEKCTYISKNLAGKNLLGNKNYKEEDIKSTMIKDDVFPEKKDSDESAEDTETYDLSDQVTYPYKIWTEENGKRTYRGDWIQ